ncbi:hypothetical protein AMTRI_Chr03g138340 [Amborella trichopoda]
MAANLDLTSSLFSHHHHHHHHHPLHSPPQTSNPNSNPNPNFPPHSANHNHSSSSTTPQKDQNAPSHNTQDPKSQADSLNRAEASTSTALAVRRPRGRPPGSKNKQKPPIIITRDNAQSLRAHILEVQAGSDIGRAVAAFANRLRIGVCILSGSGSISNVTFRQPAAPSAVVSLNGRFEILSLTGTFFPEPAPARASSSLTVFLAGNQGQVVGGAVVGSLIAAGAVVLVTATFAHVSYERLPHSEEEEVTGEESSGVISGGGNNGMGDVTGMGSLYNLPPNLVNSQIIPETFVWPGGAIRPPPPY